MQDDGIVKLYVERSEKAIEETSKKYGSFCQMITYSILRDHGESEECVNDTYLSLWNTIPPNIPRFLKAFIGKIARNKALHIYEKKNRQKRHADVVDNVLNELEECVDMSADVESSSDSSEISDAIKEFLDSMDDDKSAVFVLRYWYIMSESEIAEIRNISINYVRVLLHRQRKALKEFLEEKGLY